MTLSITIEYANISEYVTIVITSPLWGDTALCHCLYSTPLIDYTTHYIPCQHQKLRQSSCLPELFIIVLYQFT
jgi:hypothetical protein